MNNNISIMQALLQSRVKNYVNEYTAVTKDIFNRNGKLIHPGEFGTYREKLCVELLRNVVPMRLDFGSGFIIDSQNHISHQCDIIIYDAQNTPLIENREKQRFFPIETVVAVGEVKSILDKSTLREALIRLSNIKKMRDSLAETDIIYKSSEDKTKFSPKEDPRDQIFTFLMCESFSFNSSFLINELNSFYGDADSKWKHNSILSIHNGTYLYYAQDEKVHFYPVENTDVLKNCQIKPGNCRDSYPHIHTFLNSLYNGVSNTTIIYPELSYYLASDNAIEVVVEVGKL